MSSRPIYEFRSAAVRSATALPRAPLATVVSIRNAAACERVIGDRHEHGDGDGLDCLRGVCSAFALEGGCLLLLYGIWHLWHAIH
jgi:hypothetical protein